MKILLIDDDPAMNDLLGMILTPTQSEIHYANCGLDGLQLIKKVNPDIVLLDLMMPEMDGWQVTAEIRKITTTPILIMSVVDNPAMVAKALDEGADDFLVKPVPRGVLIAHINNLTRRHKYQKSEVPKLKVTMQSI
jgi:DNA-binding response OmpR family regulator